MSNVRSGRFTAEMDDEFVVFMIGMRLNKLWKVHRWLPPFLAMPRMLRDLQSHPDKGLLGARLTRSGRTLIVTQYWRSMEALQRFARNPADPHLPAWRKFNAAVGGNGDVGIFHESYRVRPGDYECVYNNMPVFGLAEAGRHVPIGHGTETAADRLVAATSR